MAEEPDEGLSDEQVDRYSRQIVLPEVGGIGQGRLLDATVLVVGAGGLGCPLLSYLCSAGVGELLVCDPDEVERSNLHRQTIYREEDLGKPKARVTAERLESLNPDCRIEPRLTRFDPGWLSGEKIHVVAEGSDEFETKFQVNDACVESGIPAVIGGILKHRGQVLAVLPDRSTCYRCIFEEPPPEGEVPDCSEAGVLGPLAGTVGSLQAYEVLKIILGFGEPLFDRLLEVELDTMAFRTVPFEPNPRCSACGTDR